MKLFKTNKDQLEGIKPNPFKLEKDIQNLVEGNINRIFNVDLVVSEFSIQNFRLDSVCFNNETNSFVIVEYKKGTNYSLIDQGFTYLSILLNYKSDFILEYNERMKKNLKRNEVDWSQSRIIFISPRFSNYQINSVNFKNLPFELWEIQRFGDGMVLFSEIQSESNEKIDTIGLEKGDIIQKVSKEVKRYDEEYHLGKNKKRSAEIVELYQKLKDIIFDFGSDVEVKFYGTTIAFKKGDKTFTDLIIYNKAIIVVLNLKKGGLKDSESLTEDISEKGHWGSGDYRIHIKPKQKLEYPTYLIKQSYDKN